MPALQSPPARYTHTPKAIAGDCHKLGLGDVLGEKQSLPQPNSPARSPPQMQMDLARAICCFILGKVGRPSFLDLRRIAFPSVKQQIALGPGPNRRVGALFL